MSERTHKSPAEAGLLNSSHPDIISSAIAAYDWVAEEQGVSKSILHRVRACEWVSDEMWGELNERGYDAFTLGRVLEPGGEHVYVGVESDRGLVLVDGTWQQFLPVIIRHHVRRRPFLPKVLVGTREEFVDFAGNAGVDEIKLNFWTPDVSPRVRVVKDFDSRRGRGQE